MDTKLNSWETAIISHVVYSKTRAEETEIPRRLQALTENYLEKLAESSEGKSSLYRDPVDGRLWEHSYPFIHMLWGNLIPALIVVTPEFAAVKYGARALGISGIAPWETALMGEWLNVDGRVVGNEASNRIRLLTANLLTKLGTASGGWDALYRDPSDGRLWEKSYPRGELHGGGPASLIVMSKEHAEMKYGIELADDAQSSS